jgi:hypothetical protein
MPSRLTVALILAFWLGTTCFVVYREVRPRYFADRPATVAIELSDEATPSLPTQWTVYRGSAAIGTLTTRMAHVPEDDTFKFITRYQNLAFDFGTARVTIHVPHAETTIRVTRDGQFREQSMTGRLEAKIAGLTLADASATIVGRLENGELVGTCEIRSPFANIDKPLHPVPVPAGQVLNPLMPVNRLKDVYPGKRWTLQKIDPLRDSINILVAELLKSQKSALLPTGTQEESSVLIAEVLSDPQVIDRPVNQGGPVRCWVIEYRGERTQARTWVSIADGRVMRQQAIGFDEELRFERRD